MQMQPKTATRCVVAAVGDDEQLINCAFLVCEIRGRAGLHLGLCIATAIAIATSIVSQ